MKSDTIELTPERWAKVDELFAGAVGLPADERESYVRAACGEDAELGDYIVGLLQLDDAGATDLESTVVDALQSAISQAVESREPMQGTMLGPYRVERTLGSGGMGIVYLAERADEQFTQQVAIKLGRHRLVDTNAEQRLRAERQILADLDHPNIARLLDGGTADDGTPYIVMEYIDGVRLDTYCDRHRLTIDERLALFHTICGAVHYAHQNLVVHRDIKPSNILVTADGVPKLLDFGIAKMIDAQGDAKLGLTREGSLMMTPENAAPEQVLARPITTATDTYALGLLLYKLLVGSMPFSTAQSTPSEYARLVCEKTPDLPSRRIASEIARARHAGGAAAKEILEQIARDRRLTPERLARRLKGDLDTIVATTLRKEPVRRYRSVNQLAEDIRLHRESQPIFARADSWRYRTGKFVRRHYAGVATAGLVAALLVSFAVTVTVQNQRIVAERDAARAVSDLLEDIFRSPDPENARGADVTARQILEEGAERINNELSEQPEIRATMMATIGRVYLNLGEFDRSAEYLEQSLSLRESINDLEGKEVAESQVTMASALIKNAEYERAAKLLDEALPKLIGETGDDSTDVAEAHFRLAELNLRTSNIDTAIAHGNEAVRIFQQYEHEQEHAIDLANAKNLLGRVHQVRGDLELTESLFREAIDIVERNGGEDNPLMAYYHQNLGVLLQSTGDLEGAEASFDEAIDTTRKVLGEEHDLLATTLVMLGTLQHNKGELGAAEISLRDALEIHRAARGEMHPYVGYDMTSLGMLLHDKGDLNDAEDMLRAALRVYDESLGSEHQYVASALTALGAVLTSDGRAKEALPVLERAIEIRRRDYEESNPVFAATLSEYGNTLGALGRRGEARKHLTDSLKVLSDQNNRRARRAKAALAQLEREPGERPDQSGRGKR